MKDTGERLTPSTYKGNVVYGEHMSRYLSVLDMIKDKVVLDAASGTGYGTQLMGKYAKKVFGVDYSKEAVEYAKKHFPADNVSFKVDNAQELKTIKDASIDVVVSMETIEHLPDPEAFVKQVKRVLKPGGVFAVSTPNDEEYREGNEFHIHEFTYDELKKLMKKYFKTTDYYFQGNALAATLFDAKDFKAEFTREMLVDKSLSVDPSKAIYFIAVASDDSEVPGVNKNIAISQHWNTKSFLEWSADQESKINHLGKHAEHLEKQNEELAALSEKKEKESSSLRNHLNIIEGDLKDITYQLQAIQGSIAYRISTKIHKVIHVLKKPLRLAKRVVRKIIS